jgi:hypothetical protein
VAPLSTFELVSSYLFDIANRPYTLQNVQRTDTAVSLACTPLRNKSCARDKSVSICMQNRCCAMTEHEVIRDSSIELRDTLGIRQTNRPKAMFSLGFRDMRSKYFPKCSLRSYLSLICPYAHFSIVPASFGFVFCIYLWFAGSIAGFMAYSDRIINQQWVGRNLAQFEALFWHSPRETHETRKSLSRCPSRDSNRTLPEYESEMLPLDTPFGMLTGRPYYVWDRLSRKSFWSFWRLYS